MSNLAIRVLVALVGIPLILLLTMAGGFYFFGLVVILSAAGLIEFYLLSRQRAATPQVFVGLLFGFCINAVFFHGRLWPIVARVFDGLDVKVPALSMSQAFLALFLVFLPVILLVELFRNRGTAALNVGTTLFGVCYVSLFLGSLIGLREMFVPRDFLRYLSLPSARIVEGTAMFEGAVKTIYGWGGYTVIVLLAAIWICDSAAYFVGLGIGKRKIFPRVSPNKTWEGTIAGFIAALLTFIIGKVLVLPYMSYEVAIVCGTIVGAFGQLGDLVESLIKRDTGVKDSSGLIPGHGGVLDRFDSLIFVSPLIFFYLSFVVF